MESGDPRLAELLGALSLSCDVAFGFPLEKALRTCVLAVELGRRHGLADEGLRDVYYATLLTYAGCTAFTHEVSRLSQGDDIAMSNLLIFVDVGAPIQAMAKLAAGTGKGGGLAARARGVVRALFHAPRQGRAHAHAMCDVATSFAQLLGMSAGVRDALTEICERWDGKGGPRGKKGEALHVTMRVVNAAHIAEIAHHREGREYALHVMRERGGGQLDPAIARTFIREASGLFEAIERGALWEAFLAVEPEPRAIVSRERLNDVAAAFAHVADLKSVWTLGHSSGVARLASAVGRAMGLPDSEARVLNRAALLHDLGRLSVPNRIWDKPGALSRSEWEAVRMHAYWTERVLSQTPLLREAAHVASAAHERLDAAGYHRAVPSTLLNRSARILAAADAYHALREPRAHRPAFAPEGAADLLVAEVRAARLDRAAVSAILDVVGSRHRPARATWPCGLTDRELEVLRLLARGNSNKQIAAGLDISPRTAQHHVIHIYQKIGRNSRAGAALFATEHGLLDAE